MTGREEGIPCDNCKSNGLISMQLAMLNRDISDIRVALYGSRDQNKKGLIERVDELTQVTQRGQWGLRVALWLGGAAVALATALAQMKASLTALFGGHS